MDGERGEFSLMSYKKVRVSAQVRAFNQFRWLSNEKFCLFQVLDIPTTEIYEAHNFQDIMGSDPGQITSTTQFRGHAQVSHVQGDARNSERTVEANSDVQIA